MRACLSLLSLLTASLAQSGPWPTTEPYWPHFPTRNVTVLSGVWSFGPVTTGIDAATVPYSAISTPSTAVVPGCTDIGPPGIPNVPQRGVAFFKSTHTCTPGRPALARFGAVNMYARLFVDGVDVGNHTAGGYTPFEMLLPPCGPQGVRELALVNSNEQSAALAPTYTGGDFFAYSGIIRPVVITELPGGNNAWVRRVEVSTADATLGLLTIRVVLGGSTLDGPLPPTVHLALAFHGAMPDPRNATVYPVVNGAVLIDSVQVPAPWAPWTIGDRNASLVELRVLETASGDVLAVRTGIRSLSVNAARIEVNGVAVKLLGYNRHTMWPDSGAAVRPDQELIDMNLLIALNANYVRGAHYPQSQSWLDLCDENGVVMWEEALGPGTKTSDMNNSWFMANQITAVSSMVETSFNHPSVVLHGFFNEGPSSDPLACVGYAALAATIRERADSSWRLVTWANNRLASDACIAYEDVISLNAYPGWYDHAGNLSYPAPFWTSQIAWVAAGHASKPLLVSETGGGAVCEWVNASAPGTVWSQSFQRDLVAADVNVLGASPRVSGLTLWQFSDIKVAQCLQCEYLPHPPSLATPWDCASVNATALACGRPKGENNKGAVDWWRRPKLSFNTVAQLYAKYGGGDAN